MYIALLRGQQNLSGHKNEKDVISTSAKIFYFYLLIKNLTTITFLVVIPFSLFLHNFNVVYVFLLRLMPGCKKPITFFPEVMYWLVIEQLDIEQDLFLK